MRFNIYALSRDAQCLWALASPAPASDRTPAMKAEEVPRPLLPWLGRACRQAREDRNVVQVRIAAAIEVNQATIARFEEGIAWPRRPRRC